MASMIRTGARRRTTLGRLRGVSPVLPLLLALGCGGSGRPSSPAPLPTGTERAGDRAAAQPPDHEVEEAEIRYTVVTDSIPDSERMEELIEPFRERMGGEIRQVIGQADVLLAKAVPEGTLGNFAADAMLWAARREAGAPVDMALTNNGGLRVPIAPGPITVGQMFELMPFENRLSVLTLTGAQVQELADAVAERRGEPIAGFTFRIEAQGDVRVARDVRVGGQPLSPSSRYRLVTNDYMANGGEGYDPLQHPVARQDLRVLLRDAFIGYVREKGVIREEIEGRINGGIGG